MRSKGIVLAAIALSLAGLLVSVTSAPAPELQVTLPLGRTSYQTNEWIHLAVARSSGESLPASELKLDLASEDGSRMAFAFPAPAVPAQGGSAKRTEHVYLNGWLLRPGKYAVQVTCDGAAGAAELEVFNHVRKSTYKLIDWGSRANGTDLELLGEDSVGFNLIYGNYRQKVTIKNAEATLRGGMDLMQCCTMGGGHQMELRLDLDWSNPQVLSGGRTRVVMQSFLTRTAPNTAGVHFYDEPGLTWHKHPETGEMSPHDIPTQVRSDEAAFGRPHLPYHKVDAKNSGLVKQWTDWGWWKLSFMEAAWKYADFGVHYVDPSLITCNQSQYGWCAYADGYYFNIARPLSVVSGHGGYDNFGLLYFNPSYFLEIARARDHAKDNWYLPAWFNTPPDRFKMEQYLSFVTNIQGLAKPPGLLAHRPSGTFGAPGIVESNKLMARLGTIFNTMPVTRPPVALLYSMSQNLHAQVQDMTDNYGGGKQRENLGWVYLALKRIQQPLMTVVEEDILDGTLAASHRALVVTGVDYLQPGVVNALERFIADGGLVLLTGECQVKIQGAIKLNVVPKHKYAEEMKAASEAGDWGRIAEIDTMGVQFESVEPLAKAIKGELERAGIRPPFECDNPGIVAGREAQGDIEYVFAVNASYDSERGGRHSIAPAVARIALPLDGRPVYDAVRGGAVPELQRMSRAIAGVVRFGPGQMRVFARTARPIGGVRTHTPTVTRDYTASELPVRLDVGATLLDNENRVLSGAAPLRIMVVDPLGVTRFDLYRATKDGTLRMSLPLAANDPAGEWKVTVCEMLARTEDTATFTYTPAPQCGALAGMHNRAVYFGRDRENVFRFFRVHQDVTIVKGSSDYLSAAADRLAEAVRPWDVRCKIVDAAEVNKPRVLSEEQASTWVGFTHTGRGAVKAGDKNRPDQVGFAIQGPVILLGNPKDNPLMAFVDKWGFLPYKTAPDAFPGRGRGMIAWQLDAVGRAQESITVIAYDAEGMNEAVGTLYEALAGLDPLTRYALPASNSVTAATKADVLPAPTVAWSVTLPDGAAAVEALPDGALAVLTKDGSLSLVKDGKVEWQEAFTGGEAWALDASANGELIAVGASLRVRAFSRKGKLLFDKPASGDKDAATVTCVAASPDGNHVAVGATNGKLAVLTSKGKPRWTVGGVSKKELADYETALRKWETDDKAWQKAAEEWEKTKEGKKPARPAKPRVPTPVPYRSAVFSGDGKTLAAFTDGEMHLLDASNGTARGQAGGVKGSFGAVCTEQGLLVTDGRKKVALLSPEDGKEVKQLAMQADYTVALAQTPKGVLVGSEPDSTVRMVKALEGKVEDQIAWEHKLHGRIVKQAESHGDLIAVAYWGGGLAIMDTNGKVLAQTLFCQDVNDVAWAGDQVVVALADGRLVAVAAKP